MRPLVFLGLYLGFILSGFLLFDMGCCVSRSSTWTLGALAMGLAGGYLARRGAAPGLRHALLGLFCVAVVTMPWVDWDSRKPFLRDLDRVQPGMDRAQVETLMGKYIHGTGWPAPPGPGRVPLVEASGGHAHDTTASAQGELELEDALVFRHTNEDWGNADWGVVVLKQGRVVRVEFLPD